MANKTQRQVAEIQRGFFFLRCQSEHFVTLGFLRRTPLCAQAGEILKDFKN